jgi:hypothetical protein
MKYHSYQVPEARHSLQELLAVSDRLRKRSQELMTEARKLREKIAATRTKKIRPN